MDMWICPAISGSRRWNENRAATPIGMTALALLDGQPDGFTTILGFDNLLFEFVEPFAGFEHLTNNLVATYKDAALRVLSGVTRMDANTLEEVVEVGATEQDGKPLFELRTPRDHYSISAFWDGKGLQTLSLLRRAEYGFFRDRCLQLQCRRFEGIAEIRLFRACQILVVDLFYDGKPTYRVGLPFCYASQY